MNYLYNSKCSYIVCVFLCILSSFQKVSSQTILNGSFEINNAPEGIDQTNISNTQFNNLVGDCFSFGNVYNIAGWGIDLITSDNWGGIAQDGVWYIGLQGGENEDRLSMKLSASLIMGSQYKLTLYDNARESYYYTSCYIEVGVTEFKDSTGDIVFTTSNVAEFDKWSLRTSTFIAPNNGEYITVRAKCPSNKNCWIKVDNFCLSQDEYCVELPEFKMPNVFTPNNDGVNDFFKPAIFKGMKSGNMIVLNRWGQVVFETDDVSNGWDGRYKNKPVTDGVYFYKIQYTTIFDETEIKHGSFSLFR